MHCLYIHTNISYRLISTYIHCNTLQHTATHCDTLQHISTYMHCPYIHTYISYRLISTYRRVLTYILTSLYIDSYQHIDVSLHKLFATYILVSTCALSLSLFVHLYTPYVIPILSCINIHIYVRIRAHTHTNTHVCMFGTIRFRKGITLLLQKC